MGAIHVQCTEMKEALSLQGQRICETLRFMNLVDPDCHIFRSHTQTAGYLKWLVQK